MLEGIKNSADLTDPNAAIWEDLKLPRRLRLAGACTKLLESGSLRRADIMSIGEVSMPRASRDIGLLMERVPGLIDYDKSARQYVLTEAGKRLVSTL